MCCLCRTIFAIAIFQPFHKMDDLSNLTKEQLVDILSTQTSLLMQMHIQGAGNIEFEKCNSLIEAVHREIKSRKEIQLEQVK